MSSKMGMLQTNSSPPFTTAFHGDSHELAVHTPPLEDSVTPNTLVVQKHSIALSVKCSGSMAMQNQAIPQVIWNLTLRNRDTFIVVS